MVKNDSETWDFTSGGPGEFREMALIGNWLPGEFREMASRHYSTLENSFVH